MNIHFCSVNKEGDANEIIASLSMNLIPRIGEAIFLGGYYRIIDTLWREGEVMQLIVPSQDFTSLPIQEENDDNLATVIPMREKR